MILKNDVVTFEVVYKRDNKIVTDKFETFAAAAGCADALNGLTRFINVNAWNVERTSGVSGSLYCYNVCNERRVCNPALLKSLMRVGVR